MSRHVTDAVLIRALDRELPAREQEAVQTHVAWCGLCAARLARVRAVLAGADDWLKAGEAAEGDVRSRGRLRAALRAADIQERPTWATFRLHAALALGLAAVAAGLSILAPAAWRPSENPDISRPIARLTPGAVSMLDADALCAGDRPSRFVSLESQQRVLSSYRMTGIPADQFELDALITPELGGTTEPANLWPQRYDQPVWNALVKDQLERLLPRLVCEGQVELTTAQREIATDWIAAYRKYFHTETPLPEHHVQIEDEEELEFESAPPRHPFSIVVRRPDAIARRPAG